MTAISANGAVTTGLKLIRNNDTPNQHHLSWPSGHTSSSFTVASVLHEYYGLKVGIPAYIIAAVVSYRMMDTGDHWASDVVFGGTLGWVVGHTIAGKHKKLEMAGFSLVPYTAGRNGSDLGVGLVRVF
jgi:membrane-associated phospholipid phosphatase